MMRRLPVGVMVALVAVLMAAPACARDIPAGAPASTQAAGDWPAGVKEAEVYVQVLRRYLGTPAENSFPEHSFTTAYVLDQAYQGTGDPKGKPERGTPIPLNAQHDITAALAGLATVVFIADRGTVVETTEGCEHVKDGSILITLGPADGDDLEVKVGVHGFVACLGATWLTYVVRNDVGSGWRVTGTTGPMAVA